MKTISRHNVHFPLDLCPIVCKQPRRGAGKRIRRFMARTKEQIAEGRSTLRLVQITMPTAGRDHGWVLGVLTLTGSGAVKSGRLVCFGPTFELPSSAANWARHRGLGTPTEIEVKVKKAA